jgi:diacylglycerol kinase family enzyme
VSRRRAAAGSVLVGAGAIVLAIVLGVEHFPRGLAVLACLLIALLGGWLALRHRGARRILAVALAVAAVVGAIVLLVFEGKFLLDLLVAVALVCSVGLARAAFRVHVDLPAAPRPLHPVLFFNPMSGGGKAVSFHLADEARRRGIEPIELSRGDDLRDLVGAAVKGGADALAMAGGDGSQAIVAELAADRDLPYACIPAGTRNHFALDLGVDRDDVVGALDAFVEGGERRVDLGEVNGRVFVNNVSLGLYAEAVQQEGYRDAKLRTLLDVAPDGLGPEAEAPAIRWRGEHGEEGESGVALLVSNNAYRLGPVIGSGTRPRLDEGVLGIAAVSTAADRGPAPGVLVFRQWRARTFVVEAGGPVPAGIDGEAVTLSSPIRFGTRHRVLRVRIAPGHPGASPSTEMPRGLGATVLSLVRIAVGHRSPAGR